MRKSIKLTDSLMVKEELKYKVNGNNSRIRDILMEEQQGFCAYTDDRLSRTHKKEIEHFNPQLKGTPQDGYNNLFLVAGKWNSEKASKWDNFQPVMHPTDAHFEERITYFEGDYFVKNDTDVEAKNLHELLKIADPDLRQERLSFIKRCKSDMQSYQQSAKEYFENFSLEFPTEFRFPRAIKEEFAVDIFALKT